jgi:hypothetical protein
MMQLISGTAIHRFQDHCLVDFTDYFVLVINNRQWAIRSDDNID